MPPPPHPPYKIENLNWVAFQLDIFWRSKTLRWNSAWMSLEIALNKSCKYIVYFWYQYLYVLLLVALSTVSPLQEITNASSLKKTFWRGQHRLYAVDTGEIFPATWCSIWLLLRKDSAVPTFRAVHIWKNSFFIYSYAAYYAPLTWIKSCMTLAI